MSHGIATQTDSPARIRPFVAPAPDVVITSALLQRPPRPRNYELEAQSQRELTSDLLIAPQQLLDRLTQLACKLTAAPSAGISLIVTAADGTQHFSWVSMAGRYAPYIGGTTPLHHSPCGYTLDCDSPQLFHRPARIYEALAAARPELVEGLVVPIKGGRGSALGTLWVAAHDDERHFDMEDARILGSLANTCGAALELIQHREVADKQAQHMAELAEIATAGNDAKRNLLATVAHEMRNPLAPILTAVQVLERVANEESRAPAAIIKRQAEQLNRLVNDLLDTARVERNEFVITPRATRLNEVISSAIESISHRFEHRRQRLISDMPKIDIPCYVDPWRLCQAISNVLDNASKYSPDDADISLGVAVTDGSVEIKVTDQGAGIPPDKLSTVFALFSRVSADEQRGPPGLGIGLWLVQRIVQLHGGAVEVISDGIGNGTQVKIAVPLVAPPVDALHPK
jgi:signal transduction histidine kinase